MTNVLLIYLVNLLMESSMSTIHNTSSSKNVKIAVSIKDILVLSEIKTH